MAEIERANGHRPSGLLHLLDPTLRLAPHPRADEVDFDLDGALGSVVRLTSRVPEEAFSSRTLGTFRQGNAVHIGRDGLLLTIGYLVVDAASISLYVKGGRTVEGELVGYNHETGFAVVRALSPLDIDFLEFGDAQNLEERESVIIAPCGGVEHSISGYVVSRREFAGSWEYLLDRAIFTAPIHPNWSGSALIGKDGKLQGIGSLWVADAEPGRKDSPGNMFVPVDLVEPILDDLITYGQARKAPNSWLGLYAAEAMERLFVSGVVPGGPAEAAGLEPGDLISSVAGEAVDSLGKMYRRIWSLGGPGTEIPLQLRRDGKDMDVAVRSDDRYRFMRHRRTH